MAIGKLRAYRCRVAPVGHRTLQKQGCLNPVFRSIDPQHPCPPPTSYGVPNEPRLVIVTAAAPVTCTKNCRVVAVGTVITPDSVMPVLVTRVFVTPVDGLTM